MSAFLSPCGTYRYRLRRDDYQGKGKLLWLMLNPSKADATVDDPTIRKVIGFTRRMGYASALVGNLFAWRATDPKDLDAAVKQWGLSAVIGPDNAYHVAAMLDEATMVMPAWGSNGAKYPSVVNAMRLLMHDHFVHELNVLGHCQSGDPKHPLMVSYDVLLA